MPDIAYIALRKSYEDQAGWLRDRAEEYETGLCQHIVVSGTETFDKSKEAAREFIHRANTMTMVMLAYERLVERAKLAASK